MTQMPSQSDPHLNKPIGEAANGKGPRGILNLGLLIGPFAAPKNKDK